jgi:hypothetical protein
MQESCRSQITYSIKALYMGVIAMEAPPSKPGVGGSSPPGRAK